MTAKLPVGLYDVGKKSLVSGLYLVTISSLTEQTTYFAANRIEQIDDLIKRLARKMPLARFIFPGFIRINIWVDGVIATKMIMKSGM